MQTECHPARCDQPFARQKHDRENGGWAFESRRCKEWILTTVAFACVSAAAAPVVVVDTGHSPSAPGAMAASGIGEYVFNRKASESIAYFLTKRGVQVIRTGHDGKGWSLKQRARAADSADLFLSIHHDSIQQAWLDQGRAGEYAGFAVLVSDKNAQWQRSLRCASEIGVSMRAAGEKPSLYHATPIKGENRPLIDRQNGVHRFDDLVVLKSSLAPAVLLEVGVIVNPNEEVKLADDIFVRSYASKVADAVVRCLAQSP